MGTNFGIDQYRLVRAGVVWSEFSKQINTWQDGTNRDDTVDNKLQNRCSTAELTRLGSSLAECGGVDREGELVMTDDRTRNLTDAEMLRWRRYFESYVADAIRSEHEFMVEIVGQALGDKLNDLRGEIESYVNAKLAIQCVAMRVEQLRPKRQF